MLRFTVLARPEFTVRPELPGLAEYMVGVVFPIAAPNC